MRTITDYKLLTSKSHWELQNEVRDYVKGGWKPQGGVAVTLAYSPGGSDKEYWAQAMVREEEVEK